MLSINYKKKVISFISTLALIFSVIGFYPTTVKAYTYPFTKSLYVYNLSSDNMISLGKNTANQGGLIILFFGAPAYSYDPITKGNAYGAKNWSAGFVSVTQIKQAVVNFITGYNANKLHTNSIEIAIGTSNYQCDMSPSDWVQHGKTWASLVENISYSGKVVGIDAASDIELSDTQPWANASKTRSWVSSYDTNSSYSDLYNFGDNGGNSDTSNGPYSDTRNNKWTTEDVWYVSWGYSCAHVIPQIFYDSSTPGYANMSNQWYHVALWAYNNGKRMSISGLLSKDGLPSAGTKATLTADKAYESLKKELAKDTRTAQSYFSYPTIMNN